MAHWRDIFLDKVITKQPLTLALAKIFQVKPSEIGIISDLTQMEENKRLLCEISICQHKFSFMASIYLLDKQLQPSNDIELVGKLCAQLDCRALVEDIHEIAPSIMFLVNPNGTYHHISIDADELEAVSIESSYFTE